MRPFLIIKTGSTFGPAARTMGDFEHWTARTMGLTNDQWHAVNVQAGEPLPDPADYAGCAITGSHDMVTDPHPWIEETADWLRRAVAGEMPLFGICFGHQLLAHALGGESGYHPDGPEIGTVPVTLTDAAADDPLFSVLPRTFPAHVTHSQTALALPPGAVLLGASGHDPHQAVRFAPSCWGVQFHPEFSAEATRHYVREQADKLSARGQDPAMVEAAVIETPESTSLMERFVQYCLSR